jgi:phosphoribosyl 1,2-cyclic phosphodiesterase
MAVLGSGSGGNAVVVTAGGTRLLLDAGLSAKQLCLRLEMVGVEPDSLDGILLSHEHGDHVRGLDVFLRKHRVPVFATALTREVVQDKLRGRVEWRVFQRGQVFPVGGMEVQAFAVPHDAVDPVGFVCSEGEVRFGVATDLGHITGLVREELKGVQGLFLESNYEQRLLDADTKRPWGTKQRIASRHGHLSNRQAAELVAHLAAHGLEQVVLGHLSGDCNCPKLACEVVREAAASLQVQVAAQDEPTGWVEVEHRPPAPAMPPTVLGAGGQGLLF